MKQKLLQIKDFKFNDEKMTFSGYASTFGNVDSYGDTVFKGAYKDTLENRERSIKMRWNHWGEVIGKWTSIKEDEKGLFVEGELTPNHSKASDVYASLQHGAIDGLSIGYMPTKEAPNETGGWDLKEIHLYEISIVEEPADIHATVDNVKSHIESLKTIKEIESFMRDAMRLSPSAAKALISRIKNGQRDVDVIDCSELIKNDPLLNFITRG